MTVSEIVEQLEAAKKAYYETDKPLMSDKEFDELEDRLRDEAPNHSYFSSVGAMSSGEKIRHEVPMLSMGKAKNVDDVEKWLKKLDLPPETEFCVQPKIDGLSATCLYRQGRLDYVSTRGDGMVGQDVSHIARYIDDIKPRIGFTGEDVEIRGELYLPRNTAFETEGRPLRNNCVGLINRKEGREDLRYVRFVCYQLARMNPCSRESETIELLNHEGFHTVTFERVTAEAFGRIYSDYLEKNRDSWLYETDGLIISVDKRDLHAEIDSRWVVDHHHHYNIALKPPAVGMKTSLLGIEWQISRQGNLVPVAVFEPVLSGGATLSRASLHNYAFARSLCLRVGDTLEVERANDVIPYVKGNLSSEDRDEDSSIGGLLPGECPACGSGLEEAGVHIRCSNGDCPEKNIQAILFWVRESGIENVAAATVRTLFEKNKIRNIRDLYHLKPSDFLDLEGFADKRIANLLDQIESSRKMTFAELISKLGIPLVQKKSLKKLGIQSVEDFLSFDNSEYVIGQNIMQWKEDSANLELLKTLLDVLEIEDVSGEEKGEICMTGSGPVSRNVLVKKLEDMGYSVSSSVTKATVLLLCDNPEGSSSKLKKARSAGIPINTYDDFFEGSDW